VQLLLAMLSERVRRVAALVQTWRHNLRPSKHQLTLLILRLAKRPHLTCANRGMRMGQAKRGRTSLFSRPRTRMCSLSSSPAKRNGASSRFPQWNVLKLFGPALTMSVSKQPRAVLGSPGMMHCWTDWQSWNKPRWTWNENSAPSACGDL